MFKKLVFIYKGKPAESEMWKGYVNLIYYFDGCFFCYCQMLSMQSYAA